MNTKLKSTSKKFMIDEGMQNKLNEICDLMKEETGENLSEAKLIRWAIHQLHKKVKKNNGVIL